MKLLALDTSTELASVALMIDEEITSEELGSQKTQAQFLLPMIDRLLVQSGVQLHQLDGVIFGCGPGSFTGLRIACSIAKGLAYSHDLALIPVSSLGSIANSVREQEEYANAPILAVLDARMREMYWSYFCTNQFLALDKVSSVQEIQVPEGQTLVVAGVGIDLYWPDFPEQIKSQLLTKLEVYPSAASIIRLARGAAIKSVSVAEAQPIYVRNEVIQGASRG